MTRVDYQLLPPLTPDEYDALRDDIARRGVMVPVDQDEAGHILDGHHRAAICAELGIEYPVVVREGWTEQQKLQHVLALNLDRRHLSRDERASIVADLRHRGMSLRAIAKATGSSLGTVEREATRVPLGTPAPLPDRVVGLDGKHYQPTRPAPAPDLRQAAMAIPTDGVTYGHAVTDAIYFLEFATVGANEPITAAKVEHARRLIAALEACRQSWLPYLNASLREVI